MNTYFYFAGLSDNYINEINKIHKKNIKCNRFF